MGIQKYRSWCPHFGEVPKGFGANLDYREEVVLWGYDRQGNGRALWNMCREDLLYFVNVFVWTYDPRKKQIPVLPFITYPYQDEGLVEMSKVLGDEDFMIDKSRDMGASWMCLMLFMWQWLFRHDASFLVVSRKADLVDRKGDPDSLFEKMRFALKRMPAFLKPGIDDRLFHLGNRENGSTIDGDATTGDIGRGGRRLAILFDEFASVDDDEAVMASSASTTACRIFNSTPKGDVNVFAELKRKSERGELRRLRFHWSLHPEKNAGLYYEDGKPRSPWYDLQVKRAVNPVVEIRRELDIDYAGSAYPFFDLRMLEELEKRYCMEPLLCGELGFDVLNSRPAGFAGSAGGLLRLWLHLDSSGRPPPGCGYVLGIDVSGGAGASNSTVTVGCRKTREKVAEFATPNLMPHRFAAYAMALGKWFRGPRGDNAFMVYEANGPGRNFGDVVMDLGYSPLYYRTQEDSMDRRRMSKYPGWWKTKETALGLFGEYRKALSENEFVNRSAVALKECRAYVVAEDGWVIHARSRRMTDPTGARDNHGDRVVADALCHRGLKFLGNVSEREEKQSAMPETCFRRRQMERQALRAAARVW